MGNTLYARIHNELMTFTLLAQNWSTGCLLALYGSTMLLAQVCGGFWIILYINAYCPSVYCYKHMRLLNRLYGILSSWPLEILL